MTILRALPGQRRAPYLPRERVRALRDANVRSIVRYAVETVPHYRELGIDPKDFGSAEDLARLPLLEKETVQAEGKRFRSESQLGADAVHFRTGGTTGLPLDVYHDSRSLLLNIAYAERDRAVEAGACGKRLRYSAVDLDSHGGTVHQVQRFYRGSSFRPFRPARHAVMIEQPLDRIVEQVNAVEPNVIRGNGGHLEAFFREALARGLQLHRPAVVVYYGDVLTDEGRELIESRLGATVLSRYGAMEAFKIGYLCEERSGFHLYEDLCHVRIVREDGADAAEGELGEIVVTNLVNRGTVLLNYRLGDLARLGPPGCPCGRTSPLLTDLEGRLADVLYLPNGEFVHPISVRVLVKGISGLVRFQFVQHERDRFELRLATVDQEGFDRGAERVRADLERLFPGCRVELTRCEALGPEPGRKFKPFVALPAPG